MECDGKISDDNGMQFSPHQSKSKVCCCVHGCHSYAKTHPRLRFHKLPKVGDSTVKIKNMFDNEEELDRRIAWEKALKWPIKSTHARVCSLHFCKEDYVLPDFPCGGRNLKKSAVPSLNLPTQDTKKNENTLKRKLRNEERCKKKLNLETSTSPDTNEKGDEYVDEDMDSIDESDCVNQSANAETSTIESTVDEVLYKDQAIQVNFDFYFSIIKSDKDLNTMTGIPNFKTFNLIKQVAEVVLFPTRLKTTKPSLSDKIIMTLLKLKQNISYSMLSVMFQMHSEENCRKAVIKMLDVLSTGLKFAISWPSKEKILRNMPECFKNFENVRAVIDVIEIFIQEPNKLCCKLASYSSYKGTNTVKFVTAVSPAGLISYISKPYLGRSSDKAVFKESNFLPFFDEGDALMINKGFLIDKICLLNNIKFIRPPFIKNKQQISKEEALLTANITKARVHIETSNQRLTVFKVLSTKMPFYLVPQIEQIFTIVCAILNLSLPTFRDD